MGTVEATRDYVSIGQLAARTRQTVRAIERVADELKLAPSLRLNGIVHFDGAQVERITAHLNATG